MLNNALNALILDVLMNTKIIFPESNTIPKSEVCEVKHFDTSHSKHKGTV